jgi:RNA polymerase sigma factor (sigma-70 family)
MAGASLRTVLHHIHTLAAAHPGEGQTDGDLLRAFAVCNDQAAFAALVKRHGPLVLAVCRRVLHHLQDAEDAFQATFLVLARKATTIHQTESLAGWLHGVAYRMASNARKAATRRRRYEEQTQSRQPETPAWEAAWREVQLVLDQEIQRLPAKYREPFVLCCLENRNGTEVARQLGLKEGTVWSRLAQARTTLRGRLARRGITLSAVLGAAALTRGANGAVVPAPLERAIIETAVEFAAGKTTGMVSANVLALAEGGIKAMSTAKLKIALAFVLVGSLLTAGAGVGWPGKSPAPSRGAGLEASEPPPPERTAAGRETAAKPADTQVPKDQGTPEDHTIRAIVRDAAGKPIAGAHVFWVAVPQPRWSSDLVLPRGQRLEHEPIIVSEGKTDAQGQVGLRARYAPRTYAAMQLVVTAPTYGLAGQRLDANPEEVTLTLRPAMKIRGQLLTPAGTPAVGVRVLLQSINWSRMGGLNIGMRPTAKVPPYWPAAVLTDNQGRFTLDGFSEGADARLTITHPDFAQEDLTVSSKAQVSENLRAFDIQPLKPDFKHALAPARPVQGVVTAKDTGKPMTGVVVEVIPWGPHGGMSFEGRTDAQGRYRVSGHAATSKLFGYSVTAYPPADSGYVAVSVRHDKDWPVGAKFLEKNLALPRGKLLRGRVLDADTGKPVVGASIVYQPKRGNPHYRGSYELRNRVLTDNNGQFTITGLAGEGVLVAEGPSPDYQRVTLPRGDTNWSMDLFPHGYTRINAPEKGEPTPATIALPKGVTLEARIVRPDGSPVPWIAASARELNAIQIDRWPTSKRFEKGLFRLTGADPDRTYRVFFIHPELHLGAVADLKYDGKPAEVRLEPTASVHGKLVDAEGAPARGYQAYALLLLTKEEGKLSRSDWYSGDRLAIYDNITEAFMRPQPKADGSFQVDNLIPDARMYIVGAAANQTVVRIPVTLKPGEVRDLGTLTLAKEEQP